MPMRPSSLNLEETDIGESLLSSGKSPDVVLHSSFAPMTPDTPLARTGRRAGLGISGPSLPTSLTRSTSLPRRVSQPTSDVGVSGEEVSHNLARNSVKLNILPITVRADTVQRIQRWIKGIAIVDFDIDQGPVIAAIFPPLELSPSDVSNIAFSSFPDSPQFDEGSQIHSFRLRTSTYESTSSSPLIPSSGHSPVASPLPQHILSHIPSALSIPSPAPSRASSPDLSMHTFIHGFSYFTQRKDPSMKRGYRQQALVVLTPHQYPALFSFTLSILGAAFAGEPSNSGSNGAKYVLLERALMDWERWPDPTAGERLMLTFLDTDMEVELPHDADEQRFWTGPSSQGSRICVPASAPSLCSASLPSLPSTPANPHPRIPPFLNAIPIFASASLLPSLWSIWENLMLCEPILVSGDSPAVVSCMVWWIVEFGRGLPLSNTHNIRPYMTINNSDCSALINAKRPGEAGLILGVTNPWLEKQCAHWGCKISLRGTTATGRLPPDSSSNRERTPTTTPTTGTPRLHVARNNNGRWTPLSADTRKTFIFGMSPGGDASDGSPGASGWKSRSYKRYISKDRVLLKKLEDAWKSGSEHDQLEATLSVRQHFNTRTRELLVPLSRYLNTLIPSPAELASSRGGSPHQTATFTPSMASLIAPSPATQSAPRTPSPSGSSIRTSASASYTPRLKPFSRTAFFASLKEYGCPLPFRSTRQRTDFYERWLKCKTFGVWLAKQEEIVRGVLEEKT